MEFAASRFVDHELLSVLQGMIVRHYKEDGSSYTAGESKIKDRITRIIDAEDSFLQINGKPPNAHSRNTIDATHFLEVCV